MTYWCRNCGQSLENQPYIVVNNDGKGIDGSIWANHPGWCLSCIHNPEKRRIPEGTDYKYKPNHELNVEPAVHKVTIDD